MQRTELTSRAIGFFTSKGYNVQTQTDMLLIFISEKREVNWLIFLVLCCCGIIGAAIYYFLFCPRHQVTISMTGQPDVQIMATGTTEDSKKDALEFMTLMSSVPVETDKCTRCGTPRQPGTQYCSNCGLKY